MISTRLVRLHLLASVLLLGCGPKDPPRAAEAPSAAGDAPSTVPSSGAPEATSPAANKGAADDPFPPARPDSAWWVVDWNADAGETEAALRKAGSSPTREANDRAGFTSLKAERADWKIAVYYDLAGKTLVNLVVTNSSASRDLGDATEARLRRRFGAPSSQTTSVEQEWRRREGEPASSGPGGLEWGMTPPKAAQAMKAAGYEIKGAPAATAPSVAFSKADVSGTASFTSGEGLVQVTTRSEGPSGGGGDIPRWLGRARAVVRVATTRWASAVGDAELAVEEKMPGGAWTVRETYTKKKR